MQFSASSTYILWGSSIDLNLLNILILWSFMNLID